MESLAALGLAAAVVQFFDFAKDLVSDYRDIYRSGKGALEDNLQLEQICEVLKGLSVELAAEENAFPVIGRSNYHLVPTEDMLGLKNLASSCKKDCGELLSIFQKLSVDNGASRRWRSIKASFRNLQHKSEINDLENRINKAQAIMTLHMQSVIRNQVASLSRIASSLKEGNETFQLNQEEKLDIIARDIIHLSRYAAEREAFSLADINQTANRLSKCLPLQDEVARLQTILSTLQFDTRPIRHNSIPEANVATFRWIFKSKFSEWLRDGDGIFWISGKAGSGKSTMMKFIADHETTHQIASEWAAPKHVAIACHYFWNPGTETQRSQQGLLQTLLFEIFRQCPNLVPLVCERRWEMAYKFGLNLDVSWTISELSACLQKIAGQNECEVRFCLFIDGLDEFSGDHVDLCQTLHALLGSRNIKLCVSSRPWNVFQDFFGQNPDTMLSIHELTREDIRKFAQSRLETHPRWKICYMGEKDRRRLIQDIADRAEGVFLWAFLVTKSLREGLINDDTVADLQRRLRSLPTDLEQLFKSLLNGVDPIYHRYMAGIIQIARCAKSPLNLCLYYHHENQAESEDYACPQIHHLTVGEHFEALELTRRRINNNTRGLLEVVPLFSNELTFSPRTVQFLHRTVRDFFRTREMDDFLSAKSRENFDPALEICKAYLEVIKCQCRVHVWRPDENFEGETDLHDLLLHATEVTERVDTLVEILDDVENAIAELSYEKASKARYAFRQLVLRYNLSHYVSAKLSFNAGHFDLFGTSALFLTLQYPKDGDYLPMDCITALLKHGHNPNKVSGSGFTLTVTPWGELFNLHFSDGKYFLTNGLIQTFLRHGANPNGNILREDKSQVSAFALLIIACFDTIFVSISNRRIYLNILQEFFDFGADLDCLFDMNSALPYLRLSIGEDFGRVSICEAFSMCLKSMTEKWAKDGEHDQGERHFLFSVTKKVLCHGVLRKSNMTTLIEVIPVVFQEGYTDELLAIAPKANGSYKHREENERSNGPRAKRRNRQKRRQSGGDHNHDLET